ncbi:hypothetical protein [Tepidimicrobium xylanilyticum]
MIKLLFLGFIVSVINGILGVIRGDNKVLNLLYYSTIPAYIFYVAIYFEMPFAGALYIVCATGIAKYYGTQLLQERVGKAKVRAR